MFFQNSVQRPFVTGLVPNLGGGLIFPNLGAANTIPGFAMQNGKVLPPAGLKPKTKPALAKPIQVANHKPLVDAVPPTRAEREAQAKAEETADRLAIQKYLRKGREAEAEGKRGVAKLYYQMAARRAEGHLKNEALASLDRVQH